jgi:hypothetical protein
MGAVNPGGWCLNSCYELYESCYGVFGRVLPTYYVSITSDNLYLRNYYFKLLLPALFYVGNIVCPLLIASR